MDTISARLTVDSNIMLHYDVGTRVPSRIITDPNRLCQVINNLVGNSIKFSPSGGRIFVKIFNFESTTDLKRQLELHPARIASEDVFIKYLDEHESLFEPDITRKPNPCDRRLLFMVSDQGIGILDENSKKLFKMFAQADATTTRKFGGSGLGLAICRQLTRILGEDISFVSAVDVGSVFFFTVNAPTPPNWQESDTIEESRCGIVDFSTDDMRKENIILLYKDRVSESVCTSILERWGYHVFPHSPDPEKNDCDNLRDLKAVLQGYKDSGTKFKCAHIHLDTEDLRNPGNYTCAVVNLFRSFNKDFKSSILAYGNIRERYIMHCIPTLSEENAKEAARYILNHLRRDNNALLYQEIIAQKGYRDYLCDLIPSIEPRMYFERFEVLARASLESSDESTLHCPFTETQLAQTPLMRMSNDVSVFVNLTDMRDQVPLFPKVNSNQSTLLPSTRVLVVEDNVLNQNLMMRMLKKLHVECDIANNGLEAIAMILKKPTIYPLIFMDLNMPELDGMEATKRIRRYLQEQALKCPIIIALTGISLLSGNN